MRPVPLGGSALERHLVSSDIVRKELQGNESTKLCVLGLIDDTHPPAAEFLNNAVVRDGLTDHMG